MTHLLLNKDFASPLDVLVKNFFDSSATFEAPSRPTVTHPIDVFEDENGLTLNDNIMSCSHYKNETQITNFSNRQTDMDVLMYYVRYRTV